MTAKRALDGGAWILSGVLALIWLSGSLWVTVAAVAAMAYGAFILTSRRGYWTGTLSYFLPVCLLGMAIFGGS